MKIHIIPTETSNFQAIVGNNLFLQADVTLRDGVFLIFRKKKDNLQMNMNMDKEVKAVDISHIKNEVTREEVKNLIETGERKIYCKIF